MALAKGSGASIFQQVSYAMVFLQLVCFLGNVSSMNTTCIEKAVYQLIISGLNATL